jgi:hypothetical protein
MKQVVRDMEFLAAVGTKEETKDTVLALELSWRCAFTMLTSLHSRKCNEKYEK